MAIDLDKVTHTTHSGINDTYLIKRLADGEIFEVSARTAEDYISGSIAGYQVLGLAKDAAPDVQAKLTEQGKQNEEAFNQAEATYKHYVSKKRK